MHRSVLLGLATCCALTFFTSQVHGSTVVAQYTPANNGYVSGFSAALPNYIPGQTFTTTGAGMLDDVTVSLAANGGLPGYVQVQIRTASGGNATSTILGTANILSPALSGTPQDFTANFASSGISLANNTQYAFSLVTDGGAWACGTNNGTYAGGSLMESYDTGATFGPNAFFPYDLQFTVTVTVPEPAGIASVAALLLGVWGSGRMRNSRG